MSFSLCKVVTHRLALYGNVWAAQTQAGRTANNREKISKCPPGRLLLYHWTLVVSFLHNVRRKGGGGGVRYSLHPVEGRCELQPRLINELDDVLSLCIAALSLIQEFTFSKCFHLGSFHIV